jgi:hypothetical protein
MNYDRARPLTPAQQFVNLKSNPICQGRGSLRRGKLVWDFQAQPTPLSRLYDVRLEYAADVLPSTIVLAPDLDALAGGKKLPHVYAQKPPRLCLYLPRAGEWGPHMRLDTTIVPWATLWLYYFEDWLFTGEWKGGGVHPGDDE